jgi:hypothetical protein
LPPSATDLGGVLRIALLNQAQAGKTTTYAELARRLDLKPPGAIHRLTESLELLMEEDCLANRPMLAALCVSKIPPRLPAPGFFAKAGELGALPCDATGAEAQAFHSRELQQALVFYASAPAPRR